MDTQQKRYLHRIWAKFALVRPMYIAAVLAVVIVIGVLALRHNYQTMVHLREAVYRADERNTDVEGALRNLREYVYGHMNTDLTSGKDSVYPPIQLKYTYERLLVAGQEQAKSVNEQIYTDAQKHCEALYPQSFSGGPRVPCIQDYIASRGGETKKIPDSLYKFDFVSPVWSPDLAGWSIVIAVVLVLLLIARIAIAAIVKKLKI